MITYSLTASAAAVLCCVVGVTCCDRRPHLPVPLKREAKSRRRGRRRRRKGEGEGETARSVRTTAEVAEAEGGMPRRVLTTVAVAPRLAGAAVDAYPVGQGGETEAETDI